MAGQPDDIHTVSLAGKVAVVTGGAGGIGGAVVARFLEAGAKVMTIDMAEAGAAPASDRLSFRRCDVSVEAEVEAAVAAALSTFGRIDVLVHAAAVTGGSGPFLDVTLSEWRRHLDTNLTGTFLVCRAAARAMVEGKRAGSMVTIGSVNSFAAERSASPYVASKGGVWTLTRAMAVDLAPHGIRVNMIAPGPIRVERNATLFDAAEARETFRRSIPLGGPGSPLDVAAAAEFLASEACRYMTGAVLGVDGGLMAYLAV